MSTVVVLQKVFYLGNHDMTVKSMGVGSHSTCLRYAYSILAMKSVPDPLFIGMATNKEIHFKATKGGL